MSSRNKRKSARKNGAQAAGTKSPAGLQKSSMNALRHGFTSKALVLTNESQSQFDALLQTYIARFQPQDYVEMDLIDQIVAAQWRLRRIWCMQTAALDLKMDRQEEEIAKTFNKIDQATRATVAFTAMANEERSLDLLLRYETAYNRMYSRALKTLQSLQAKRPDTATSTATSAELRNEPDPDLSEPETPVVNDAPELPEPVSINETRPKPVISGIPDREPYVSFYKR